MTDPLAQALAAVPRAGADAAVTTRGEVLAIDYGASRLEVRAGDGVMVIPYLGFIDYYPVGSTVLILNEPTGPIALGVIGARLAVSADAAPGGAAAPTGLALSRSGSTLTAAWDAVASATLYRVRTSTDGGTSWAPTVTTTALSQTFGIGQGTTVTVQVAALVSGTWTLWSASVALTYPLPTGSVQLATVAVQPSDSGTFRVSAGAWDRWNTDRFGGARDVYQGSAYGSGTLIGWVGYGDRIAGLGATEIVSARLWVRRTSWGYPSDPRSVTVQGSASGTQPGGAPTGSGATASSGTVTGENVTSIDLPATVCEALRTGAVKGFITTGSAAAGWYGTDGSMGLEITYRKAA